MLSLFTAMALVAVACGDDDTDPDAGPPDQGPPDLGPPDLGPPVDMGQPDLSWCTTPPTTAPPAPPDPGPAAEPPAEDCGEPIFPAGTPLRRWPYLQSVTPTTAKVVWTSTGGGDGSVRIRAAGDTTWLAIGADAELFDVARTADTEDYSAYLAVIEGLEPSSAYCYEVVEDGEVLATNLTLRTGWVGAGATEGSRPLRILAFGDSGSGSPEQAALRDVFMEEDYDLFLHLGDMAYGDGEFVEFEANMFAVYRDLLHRVPSWPTIGNHEMKTDSGQPYLDVYYLPEQAWREEENEYYYSFDQGNVHFVSLDSNGERLVPIALDSAGNVDDDMVDWLADDLASSDAEWKIAIFHHPPYSSSSRAPNGLVRDQLLPVLEAGGVDLVLVGHDHHYERTVPMAGGCVAEDPLSGITYIVAGAGGAGLRFDVTEQWWAATSNDQKHSFFRMTIHGCELRGEAVTIDGELIDEIVLDGCD